jgi:hypothetical protein
MRYQIRVQGHLDQAWSASFADLTITNLPGGEAVLAGDLVDQAALHGVLALVRDLGLPLLAVTRADPDAGQHPRRPCQTPASAC